MTQENVWKLVELQSGFTKGELVVFAAGRNVGKTQLTQEMVEYILHPTRPSTVEDNNDE